MKKSQAFPRMVKYLLVLALGAVILYIVYIAASALFAGGRMFAAKECQLIDEYDEVWKCTMCGEYS